MKYKLLVLDLDGTLTNNKKEITEHTLRTLIDAQERGVKIVLASGRPTYGIAPIAEKLELKKYGGYILSYNGGEITNWQTGELMYENVLDAVVFALDLDVVEHGLELTDDSHVAIDAEEIILGVNFLFLSKSFLVLANRDIIERDKAGLENFAGIHVLTLRHNVYSLYKL